MKRGTPRHPKILRLLQALDLTKKHTATAVGYLELLWHFTAEFAPRGDVGKYADDQIEGACHWYGRRGRLVQALTTAKWLDLDDRYRLVTHGWSDHADSTVRKKLERAHESFVKVTAKVTGQIPPLSGTVPANISLPEPLPLPLPTPEPEPAPQAACSRMPELVRSLPAPPRRALPPSKLNGHGAEWSAALYARHPKKKDEALVGGALYRVMEEAADPPALFQEIDRVHRLWCATFDWSEKNGRFAPVLAAWLLDHGWTQEPHEDKTELERMMDRI